MSAKRLKGDGACNTSGDRLLLDSPSTTAGGGATNDVLMGEITSRFWIFSNDDLRKADSAIQMHLKINRLTGRITFDDFYALSRKIDFSPKRDTDADVAPLESSKKEPAVKDDMRLLLELLCVFSPSIYQYSKGSFLLRGGDARCWCLESCNFPSREDRNDAVRLCLNNRVALKSEQESLILEVLTRHMEEKEALKRRGPRKDVLSDCTRGIASKLGEEMTIDERVAARANVKRQRTEESNLDEGPEHETHKNLLVRLVDGLWQHANHVLAQRRLLSTARTPSGPKTFNLTLKDTVDTLKRTLVIGGSSVMTLQGDKVSKRQLVASLQKLGELVPEFIVITDSTSTKGLTKNATVWINLSNVKIAHSKLTGQAIIPDKGPIQQQSRAINLNAVTSLQVKYSESPRLVAFPDTTITPAILQKTHQVVTANSLHDNHLPSEKWTGQVELKRDTKRAASDGNVFTPSKAKKRKRELRINPNLILTHADHTGGEIIEFNPFERSPRGLKSLFEMMNTGQRI
jgi:hypothetical protein